MRVAARLGRPPDGHKGRAVLSTPEPPPRNRCQAINEDKDKETS
jgi:hypothetical protein